MIGRRAVITGLLTAPLAAQAAAQGRKPLLALLLAGSEKGTGPGAWPVAIRRALADLGWVEGRNIEIVTRFAEGALDRLPTPGLLQLATRHHLLSLARSSDMRTW
jgi:hypothetical protein